MRDLLIVAYPGVAALDVAGPAQAFASVAHGAYRLTLASLEGGLVSSDCPGVVFDSVALGNAPTEVDTLLVPGGLGVHDALRNIALVDAVREMASASRRVASVCVGAFIVAEAGLLDDRTAATHWRACADFERRYPRVRLQRNPIWVRDGRYWSSAGVSAGVDLALALIEEDHGAPVALAVARELVVFLRRPGGQSQFSAALSAQAADAEGRFGNLVAWMADHLSNDLTAERLADRCAMSSRTFARLFPQATGQTPARYVELIRVEAARNRLETTDQNLEEIAVSCGFGDEQRMRRAFVRRFGVAPAELRKRFRG